MLIVPRRSCVFTRAASVCAAISAAATADSSTSIAKSERERPASTRLESDVATSVFMPASLPFNSSTRSRLAAIESEYMLVRVLPVSKLARVESNVSLNASNAFVGFFTAAATAAIVATAVFCIPVNIPISESRAPPTDSSRNMFSFSNAIWMLRPAFSADRLIEPQFATIATVAAAIAAAINPMGLALIAVFSASTANCIDLKPRRITVALVPTENAKNPASAAPAPIVSASMLLVMPRMTALAAVIAPANRLIPPTSPIFLNSAATLSSKFERRPGSAVI